MKKALFFYLLLIIPFLDSCLSVNKKTFTRESDAYKLNYFEYFTDDSETAKLREPVTTISQMDLAFFKNVFFKKQGINIELDDFEKLQDICKAAIEREVKRPNPENSLDRFKHSDIPLVPSRELSGMGKIVMEVDGKVFPYEYYTWKWSSEKMKKSAKLIINDTIYDKKHKHYKFTLLLTVSGQIAHVFHSNTFKDILNNGN